MKIFEFAIVYHPVKRERDQGQQSRIIVGPKCVLAQDEKSAALLAGREIPEDMIAHLDRLEVAVRPF